MDLLSRESDAGPDGRRNRYEYEDELDDNTSDREIDMDPKANIDEQLRLARRFIRTSEDASDTVVYDESDVVRLAELVVALDEWQRSGGFSPYVRGWK